MVNLGEKVTLAHRKLKGVIVESDSPFSILLEGSVDGISFYPIMVDGFQVNLQVTENSLFPLEEYLTDAAQYVRFLTKDTPPREVKIIPITEV